MQIVYLNVSQLGSLCPCAILYFYLEFKLRYLKQKQKKQDKTKQNKTKQNKTKTKTKTKNKQTNKPEIAFNYSKRVIIAYNFAEKKADGFLLCLKAFS